MEIPKDCKIDKDLAILFKNFVNSQSLKSGFTSIYPFKAIVGYDRYKTVEDIIADTWRYTDVSKLIDFTYKADMFKQFRQYIILPKSALNQFPMKLYELKDLVYLDVSLKVSNTDKYRHYIDIDLLVALPNLIYLNVGSNFIEESEKRMDEVVAERVKRGNLQVLIMSNCIFVDKYPECTKCLGKLKKLHVHNVYRTFEPVHIDGCRLHFPDDTFQDNLSLEELIVSKNGMSKKIPDSLLNLKNLVTLDLSENHVNLPDKMFEKLINIETLNISNMCLRKLPSSLNKLKKIVEINANNNFLLDFPIEVLGYEHVKLVDLSDNRFHRFPIEPELMKYEHRIHLNLNSNKLNDLDFEKIPDNLSISCYNNDFDKIPDDIIVLGSTGIKQYLIDLKDKSSMENFVGRVVVIGEGRSGKSTISETLCNGRTPFFYKSTIVSNTLKFVLQSEEDSMPICLFDMAGQDLYDSTHRFFYSKHSLYILVINVWDYVHKSKQSTERWLNHISCYSPGAKILVVCTFIDFPRKKPIESTVDEIKNIIKSMRKDQITSGEKSKASQSLEAIGVITMKANFKNDAGYRLMTDEILKFFLKQKNHKQETPYSWTKFEELLCSDDKPLYVDEKILKDLASKTNINNVEIVLNYLNNEGIIIYKKLSKEEKYVFNDPQRFVELFRCFFSHQISSFVEKPSVIKTVWLKLFSKQKILDLQHELENNGVENIEDKLNMLKIGLVHKSVSDVIIQFYFGDEISAEVTLDLLERFEYCFQMNHDDSFIEDMPIGRNLKSNEVIYLFPCYLTSSIDGNEIESMFQFDNEIAENVNEKSIIFNDIQCCLDLCPRLVVRSHKYSSKMIKVWKNGLLGVFNEVVLTLVRFEAKKSGKMDIVLTAKTCAKQYMNEIGRVLRYLYIDLITILDSVPGIKKKEAYVVCPSCKRPSFEVTKSEVDGKVCGSFDCTFYINFQELKDLFINIDKPVALMCEIASFLVKNENVVPMHIEIAHHLLQISDLEEIRNSVRRNTQSYVTPDKMLYYILMKWNNGCEIQPRALKELLEVLKKIDRARITDELEEYYNKLTMKDKWKRNTKQ